MGLRQRRHMAEGKHERWSRNGLSIIGMNYKDLAKVLPDESKLLKELERFVAFTSGLTLDVGTDNMIENFQLDIVNRIGQLYQKTKRSI